MNSVGISTLLEISLDTSPAIKSLCVETSIAFLLEFSFITSSFLNEINSNTDLSVVFTVLLKLCIALYPS